MQNTSRLEKTLKCLSEYGYLSVSELSNLVFASLPTVRRDLILLEKQGFVTRSHGGAFITKSVIPPITVRLTDMKHEKQNIAKSASSLIEDGNIVFIDTSTTAMCVIPYLSKKHGITVITNSVQAIPLLNNANIKTKCTGGDFDADVMGFVGHQAEMFFDKITVDIAFLSTPCINNDGTISDYSENATYVRQRVLMTAKKSVYLFESAKIGKKATFNLGTIDDFDYLLSNTDITNSFNGRKLVTTCENGVWRAKVN